jgi:hypothetical protein
MSDVTVSATTPTRCGCCGVGTAVLACRTRSGSATLCGFDEYTSPSVPPLKYRKKTFSGGIQYCQRNGGAACLAPNNGAETWSYSGFCQYDPATCTLSTASAIYTKDTNYVPGTCGPGGTITHPAWTTCSIPSKLDAFDSGSATVALTPTTRTITGTGLCATVGGGFGYIATGTSTETLSDLDTDEDAINRAAAAWSGWTNTGDGTGGTCVPSTCCKASIQIRTTFTFTYQAAQFRATLSGLAALTTYILSVSIYRRLIGVTDWALLQTNNYGFVSDGAGNYQMQDDVPNLEGYETYADRPVARVP